MKHLHVHLCVLTFILALNIGNAQLPPFWETTSEIEEISKKFSLTKIPFEFWAKLLPEEIRTTLENPNQFSAENPEFGSNIKKICKTLNISQTFCKPELIVETIVTVFLEQWKYPSRISSHCINDIAVGFFGNLLSNQSFINKYSIQQIDAAGKPGAGLLQGNTYWSGNFEQCHDVDTIISSGPYQGTYCTVFMDVTSLISPTVLSIMNRLPGDKIQSSNKSSINYCSSKPADFRTTPTLEWGICAPASCSSSDIMTIMYSLTSIGSANSPVCNVFCQKRQLPWTKEAIVMLTILSLIMGMVMFGTLFDYYYFQPNEKTFKKNHKETEDYQDTLGTFSKVLLAFSIYTNGKRILDTSQKPGQINCIHGLRFISMSWVVLGHSYETIVILSDNLLQVAKLKKQWNNMVILNATFSVDTFFLISGTLLSFLWFKRTIKSNGKQIKSAFNWVMFYVHRYLRLTPVYAVLLGAQIALLRYMMRGPFTDQKGTADYDRCESYWWTNLLYINNFISSSFLNMCHSEFWYLANDMQFHVVAPIFLVSLWMLPAAGLILSACLMFASMITIAALTLKWHLPAPADFLPPPDPKLANPDYYWMYVYIVPWTRCNAYIIGVLLGWYLNQPKSKKKLSSTLTGLCWTVAIILALAILFGMSSYQAGTYWDVGYRAAYSALCRTLWSLAIAWLIFACYRGYGGPVDEFLSWPGWIPLSRLTYCAYLVHVSCEFVLMSSHDRAGRFTNHFNFILTRTFPLLGFAYFVAFFASAGIEVPFSNLEMLFLMPKEKGKNESKSENSKKVSNSEFTMTAPNGQVIEGKEDSINKYKQNRLWLTTFKENS